MIFICANCSSIAEEIDQKIENGSTLRCESCGKHSFLGVFKEGDYITLRQQEAAIGNLKHEIRATRLRYMKLYDFAKRFYLLLEEAKTFKP